MAYVLDAWLGDPRWLPHPVRGIGAVIEWMAHPNRLQRLSPMGRRVAGCAMALALPATSALLVWLAIRESARLSPWLGEAVEVLLAFSALAMRDLADHAHAVWTALAAGRTDEARQAVSMIVGRDTQTLDEHEIVRGTVETVAESTCDGIVAPLFYLALGGPALAWSYKTVNTLDSLIGHPEPPFREVGWASARLDDAVNWIPARLSALLITMAAGLRFGSTRTIRAAWQIWQRDGANHPSPNSGRPEAAMAGALGVQLGGLNAYRGVPRQRPVLGLAETPLHPSHIPAAVSLMWIASALALGLALGYLRLA
jgi:adenosylcobinamide-phosphate synthase